MSAVLDHTMIEGRLHLEDATPAELEALSAYKSAADDANGNSTCFTLNRQLEHSLTIDDMGSLGAVVRTLDGVFRRCPRLSRPTTVYRAIGLRSHYPLAERKARFRNRSFWSASANRDASIGFLKAEYDGAGGALLALELPVGIPAYDMETLAGAGGTEVELLLPRGILWEVGPSVIFDGARQLLPHVAKKFSNVVEVTLIADPNWSPI
ncbi:ADP-ribosyltransferase [Sphingomonas xanthus]|nr:ADP-ribosyltransferase [Sphingomonas xanthus]